MTEHHLDQFLGERLGDATRDEVLAALREHSLGTVVIALELADGSEMLHLQGRIAEAGRDPGTWETAGQFVIIQEGLDAQLWHLNPEFREQLGKPDIDPGTYLLQVPETGIEQYAGTEGSAGYRFDLGGGVKLALVLWHDAMHVTATGEVAPGIGDFRPGITGPDQDGA